MTLKAKFLFTDGTGSTTITDSSDSSNNLVYKGSTASGWSTEVPSNGGLYSYHFSGTSNDYFDVDLGTNNWGIDSDFSIAVWVRCDTGATNNVVFCTGNEGEYSLQIYHGTTKWYLSSKQADGTDTLYEIGLVEEDTWQHIAVTYDYSTQILNTYLNNVKTENTTITTMGGFYNYRLGSSRSAEAELDGYIDNFIVYNTVLTDSEVSNIYNYADISINNFSQYIRNKVNVDLEAVRVKLIDSIVSASR